MKDHKFEGVSYTPSQVAGMTQEDFAKQHAHLFKGHKDQAEKLKAFHAEATRVHNESTAPAKGTAPTKENKV